MSQKMCIKRSYSVNAETSKVMKKTIKRSNSCPNISGFTDKSSNTTDTEKIVEIKNLCVVCGVDIGDDNPRQYCMKTYCPSE